MEEDDLLPEDGLKVGDCVRCLYKLLDNSGNIYDVMWVYGTILSIEHEFTNKYPYEVKFKHNDMWKTSLFESSEVKFYDRLKEVGARLIPIKEEKYITWPEEGWYDDYQP